MSSVEHRVVRAAVAEGELVRLVTRCQREQLVAEADAEHGETTEKLGHSGDLLGQRFRVAGAVGQDDAVVGSQLVRVHVVGVHRHGCARGRQAREDRALAAVVDDGDADVPFPVRDVRLGRRHACGEGLSLHSRQCADLVESDADAGSHGAVLAQVQHERARVHAGQRRRRRALPASPSTPGRVPRA